MPTALGGFAVKYIAALGKAVNELRLEIATHHERTNTRLDNAEDKIEDHEERLREMESH
jgi:hypothetical protein